jgi:hypothetical protein
MCTGFHASAKPKQTKTKKNIMENLTQINPAVLNGPEGPVAPKGPQFTLLIANKTGHDEKTFGLEDTIDYLTDLFKTNRMWITVNDSLFNPEAAHTGSAEDNKLVERDRARMRTLILDNTKELEDGTYEVPTISAVGALVGGYTALPGRSYLPPMTPKLVNQINKVRLGKRGVRTFLINKKGVPASRVEEVIARYNNKISRI